MKVLWILPGDPNSKVNMIFAKRSKPDIEALGVEIVTYHLLSRLNPISLLKSWIEVRNLIKKIKPNLVHAHYGSVTGLFSTLLGLPAIVTFRGSDVNGDPANSHIRRIVSKFTTALAAGLSSHNIYVSENLRKRIIYPGKSSTCLPSPLKMDLFKPMNMNEARNRLGLKIGHKIISFITSGDRSVKRLELAEDVIQLLKSWGHEVELLKIYQVDPLDVPTWINASNCLLFTSLSEGSPNTIREAMACGVPVVTVNVGDVEFWVKNDPQSRIVYSDQAIDLAHAIVSVWNQDGRRERKAKLGLVDPKFHAESVQLIYRNSLKF